MMRSVHCRLEDKCLDLQIYMEASTCVSLWTCLNAIIIPIYLGIATNVHALAGGRYVV